MLVPYLHLPQFKCSVAIWQWCCHTGQHIKYFHLCKKTYIFPSLQKVLLHNTVLGHHAGFWSSVFSAAPSLVSLCNSSSLNSSLYYSLFSLPHETVSLFEFHSLCSVLQSALKHVELTLWQPCTVVQCLHIIMLNILLVHRAERINSISSNPSWTSPTKTCEACNYFYCLIVFQFCYPFS